MSMLKTAKLLTITVPKPIYKRIRKEATRRKATISGLLRESFEYFTKAGSELYTDEELKQLLRRDTLSSKLRKELQTLLSR